MRALIRILFVVVSVALAASARADDLELGVNHTVALGHQPEIHITVRKPIKRLSIELLRSDGHSVQIEKRRLKVGKLHRLQLPSPEGHFDWKGTLRVAFRDGTDGEMPLEFTTSVQGPMKVETDATRKDILAGKVTVRTNRAVERVEVEVNGVNGVLLVSEKFPYDGAAPGTPLELRWEPPEAEVVRVKVMLYDMHGAWNGVEWFPWSKTIAHDDVVFASGKWDIRKAESPKLRAVLGEIREMIRKYDSAGGAQLWIAGHTDTVGTPDSNQILSEKRAQAIGRWFRRHGLKVPVHFRGFGEEALAVATPDQTDEAQNRRAEYLVAAEDPFAGRGLQGSWKQF